jgi:hypothetical protein
VRVPSQRRALGALFLVLAAGFTGVAIGGAQADVWPVAVAAAVLAVWMLGLVLKAWR